MSAESSNSGGGDFITLPAWMSASGSGRAATTTTSESNEVKVPSKVKLESLVDAKRHCAVCGKQIVNKGRNNQFNSNTGKHYCSTKCSTAHMKPQ